MVNTYSRIMDTEFLLIVPLLTGFALDCLLGDPRWMPHPVRAFGAVIAFLEKQLNRGSYRKLKGILSSALLVFGIWALLFFLFQKIEKWPGIYLVLASLAVFFGLANRSLISESYRVMQALRKEGIATARKQLSYIVGRDTAQLNEQQIRTAVLETMAENLSDGVIGPLFYFALGGVPLMIAYKMASTLDSMIAYKNERFKQYGWFAARLDDLLNLIPARLTALLMVLLTFSWNAAVHVVKYGRSHSSPNSAYPEAALAGWLRCRFGGPNIYHGKLVDKPYIGHHIKQFSDRDFYKTAALNTATTCLTIALIILFFYFRKNLF